MVEEWDQQIVLFAKYFLIHARLPEREQMTLLDVGCGTGSALRIIKEKYPDYRLAGCDIEAEHIRISEQMNGKYGSFFVSDIESIDSEWDIVFISNLLEHLKEWKHNLDCILSRTGRIYLLVPYKEKIEGILSDHHDHSHHINSFDRNSFDYLRSKGYRINQRVIDTPYAWGSGPIRSILEKFYLDKYKQEYRRELLVCITSGESDFSYPFHPFLFSILKKWLTVILPIYFNKYLVKKRF